MPLLVADCQPGRKLEIWDGPYRAKVASKNRTKSSKPLVSTIGGSVDRGEAVSAAAMGDEFDLSIETVWWNLRLENSGLNHLCCKGD